MKYRSGLAGVTANLRAKAVVIDGNFPDEMLECVALSAETRLLRSRRDKGNVEEFRQVREPSAQIRSESLAFIQHSAGTTGLQKGVALTHAAVLCQIGHLSEALKIDSTADRVYSWLPLYHDMGLIAAFMLPMVCHVPVVMQSALDWVMQPESMLQVVSEYKCTLVWMPNFAFQFVPRRTPQKRRTDYDLSSLRLLINLFVVSRKKDLLIIGAENIYPQDIEEIVSAHLAIHDGRVIAMGVYNPSLGTEDVVVVAEVEREELLCDAAKLEQDIRSRVVVGLGIAVRTIFLKPPKWIVKSTAGKAARSATREKLLREHPELNTEV